MNKLAVLGFRILLLNAVVLVPTAWLASKWYVGDVQAESASTQFYLSCDTGGWIFDFRRPVTPANPWSFNVSFVDRVPVSGSPLGGQVGNVQPRSRSTIDAFDAARFWTFSAPGIRFLHEDSRSLVSGGQRWAIGLRHQFLVVFVALMTAMYCRQKAAATEPEQSELAHKSNA